MCIFEYYVDISPFYNTRVGVVYNFTYEDTFINLNVFLCFLESNKKAPGSTKIHLDAHHQSNKFV